MTTLKIGPRGFKRALIATAVATLGLGTPAFADGHQVLDEIHFIIPGGAGGGWDGTARGTGEALTEAGLVGTASYENMSGGGGGVAIGYMIENAESLEIQESPATSPHTYTTVRYDLVYLACAWVLVL